MSCLCRPARRVAVFACAGPAPLAVGYVEGEYVLLAPIEVAELETRRGQAGRSRQAGAAGGYDGDQRHEDRVAQAEAALAQAQAHLADLQIGKRPEEIAVLEATLTSARAQKTRPSADGAAGRPVEARYRHPGRLRPGRDAAQVSTAMVGQAEANLAVARLPARPEAIKAAENQVKQAKATLEQANWRLSKRTIAVPAAGRIDDIIRNPGDLAGPSAPILSMLPDGAVKLRLYLPETSFPRSRSAHCSTSIATAASPG